MEALIPGWQAVEQLKDREYPMNKDRLIREFIKMTGEKPTEEEIIAMDPEEINELEMFCRRYF